MGGIIGTCAGSCLASCGCQAMQSMCGGKKGSKTPHLLIMFISVIVALTLRYWGGPMLIHLCTLRFVLWLLSRLPSPACLSLCLADIYDLKLCTSDKCVGFGEAISWRLTLT